MAGHLDQWHDRTLRSELCTPANKLCGFSHSEIDIKDSSEGWRNIIPS